MTYDFENILRYGSISKDGIGAYAAYHIDENEDYSVFKLFYINW